MSNLTKYDPKPLLSLTEKVRSQDGHITQLIEIAMSKAKAGGEEAIAAIVQQAREEEWDESTLQAYLKAATKNQPSLGEVTGLLKFLTAFSRSQEIIDREIGITKRSDVGKGSSPVVAVFGQNVTIADLEKLTPSQREEMVLAHARGDEEAVQEILKS